ncbi:MAG: capsular biosynthesis protein [Muribaculum sp.]|nr:capsular biosynthesis protein [Muribaculum sp.]
MSILSSIFSSPRPVSYHGMTDWHSHILPGVDDGVADIETSLAILAEYEKMGFSQVWLTPHIMEDVPNTTIALKKRFDTLLTEYNGKMILRLAAENMIDGLFYERLKNNDILPIGDKHEMLLVETTVFNAPMDFEDTLCEIRHKGYYPLLAHPERYDYLRSIKEYRKLKEIGVRFQLNLLSLDGAYGKGVQKKAQDLLSLGMYDHFGSDLHRIGQVEWIKSLKLSKRRQRLLGVSNSDLT